MNDFATVSFIPEHAENLPFKVLVIAQLTGIDDEHLPYKAKEINRENFSDVMKSYDISLRLELENDRLCDIFNVEKQYFTINYPINSLASFHPEAILEYEPNLNIIADIIVQLRACLQRATFTFDQEQFTFHGLNLAIFECLPVKRADLEWAVCELESVISDVLDAILHHPQWQQIESSWRGLWWLCQDVTQESRCIVECLDYVPSYFKEDVCHTSDVLDSDLYHHLYSNHLGLYGGIPYGSILLDYAFSNQLPDLQFLGRMAQLCAHLHVPLISGVSPQMFTTSDFSRLVELGSLIDVFASSRYIKWRNFCEQEQANYVALTLPRLLIRSAYNPENCSLSWYHEQIGRSSENCLWLNAAYGFTHNLIKSFMENGFCNLIFGQEGGQLNIEQLHAFNDALPVEVTLSEICEAELIRLGFNPVCSRVHAKQLLFQSANSVQWGYINQHLKAYNTSQMAAAQLQYRFIVLRTLHCIKILFREKIGSIETMQELTDYLNVWLRQFVSDVEFPSKAIRAQRPLRDGKIIVTEASLQGWYDISVALTPHFKFLGNAMTFDASLTLAEGEA